MRCFLLFPMPLLLLLCVAQPAESAPSTMGGYLIQTASLSAHPSGPTTETDCLDYCAIS